MWKFSYPLPGHRATINYKVGWEKESLAEQCPGKTWGFTSKGRKTNITAAVSATSICKCMKNRLEEYTKYSPYL